MTMTNSAWRSVGFRLDVRKLKGVVFAVVGVLLGTSSAVKAGLYYAVEFTESLGRSFEGKRFMARGGSVDVEVEYTDSAAGFWRIGVYLTPTGP